jgi:hypothetical protein
MPLCRVVSRASELCRMTLRLTINLRMQATSAGFADWYVLAYFREDLLDRIRPGMRRQPEPHAGAVTTQQRRLKV